MPTGNDIVAWRHQRCVGKAANQRFLDKTCTPAEQEAIQNASHPDNMLWLLWSLKEAAYKLSCFLGNREKFHGLRFNVQVTGGLPEPSPLGFPQDELIKGIMPGWPAVYSTIEWAGHTYTGCSMTGEAYVHSIVVEELPLLDKVSWAITQDAYTDKNDFSEAVRGFAKRLLNHDNAGEEKVVDFSKDADGIPFVILQSGAQQYISLSHDQQWLSFAYMP